MPGYRQRGNSCGAYAATMALNELGRLPRGWSHAMALNIWGKARFLHSEHPEFENAGYSNPVRLALALRDYSTPAAVYVSPGSIALSQHGYREAQVAQRTGAPVPAPYQRLGGLYLLLSMIRSMAVRSGVGFVQADGIRAITTQPTTGYAIAACLQNGGPALHFVLIKKKLMRRTVQVYDPNWDDLEWHDPPRVPANLNDPVESLATQAGMYSLQYTGLSVVMLG